MRRMLFAASTAAALAAALALGQTAPEPGSIRGRISHPLLGHWPAAVYVDKVPGKSFAPPAEHALIDQVKWVFVPHVLPVLKGTTVDFKNSDDVSHNIFSSRRSPTVFDLGTYRAGTVRSVTFETPGVVSLLCNVHSEMSAYVVVVETPYFALTDDEGRFAINGVPPGSYQLTFWHEALESGPRQVVVAEGQIVPVAWLDPKRK